MASEDVDDLDLLEGEETEYTSLLVARQAARDFFGSRRDMSSRIVEMSSARPTFGEEDIRAGINATRADVRRIAEEYVPGRNPISLRVGSMMDLRSLVELRLDLGVKATRNDLQAKAPPKTIVRGGIATTFGYGIVDLPSGGIVDNTSVGLVDRVSKGLVDQQSGGLVDRLPNYPTEKVVAYWPAVPKRDLVLADAMSTISVLSNPKFPSLSDIDVLLSDATKGDPFARAAMAGAPTWMKAQRYGTEARRILHDELRFDLSYQGVDYSNMDAPVGRLDPARRRLVEALRSYALAAAKVGRYQQSGEFSMESPFGVNLTGGSLLQSPGLPAASIGLARRTLSRAMDPYFLDVVNPLMDWAFPDRYGPSDASGVKRSRSGPQDRGGFGDFLANSTNFLSSWLFPVIGARDATGSHWIPGGAPSLSAARTLSALRQGFGAPKMAAYLDDEGFGRLVSMKKLGDSYSRDIFFLMAGGDAGWSQIRQNFVLSRVRSPRFSDNSQVGSAKLIGGQWTDEYTGLVHEIVDVHELRGVAEKVGKLSNGKDHFVQLMDELRDAKMDIANGLRDSSALDTLLFPRDVKGRDYKVSALIKSPYEVDHVLALDWAYEHGGADLFDSYLRDPTNERSRRILLAFAHLGAGVNPDQFILTDSEINRDKSSKGPDQWAPFYDRVRGVSRARSAEEHAHNLEYIRRFLSSQASAQAVMERALGERDPDYLAMTRSEQLAVLGIQRGYDLASERVRPFLDFWMGYYEYPDLLGETFHRKVNATAIMGMGGLAYTLAGWKLTPFNQIYLLGRAAFAPAFTQGWNAFFHGDASLGSPLRRGFGAAMHSFHGSFGGLPFGLSADASDPVRTARFLRRGGRLVKSVDFLTNEVHNVHKTSIGYMTWGQGIRYGWGRPDALGRPGMRLNGGRTMAMSHLGTEYIPLTGRGILNPSAFVEDFIHALTKTPKPARGTELTRMRSALLRLDKASRITIAEGIIKFVDYGLVRGNPGLLVNPQIFAILGIEAMASKSSAFSGVTGVEMNPFQASSYGAGGFRGYWKRARADQRAQIRVAMESYRQALRVPESGAYDAMRSLRKRWHRGEFDILAPKLIPSGPHRRIKGVEYMAPVPHTFESSRPDFHWVWKRAREEDGIWRDVSRMGFVPDPERMGTLQDVLDQARDYNRARAEAIAKSRAELRALLRVRASVSRDLSSLSGAFDLLNSQKRLPRFFANVAATYPRLPAIAGRVSHVPGSLGEVAVAPFKMARTVGRAIQRNRVLRGSLDAVGIGFNALGWYESVGRYNAARALVQSPWRALTREQKASQDAYLHPEFSDFVWDIGASIFGLYKPNVLSAIDAGAGISLALYNQVRPRQLMAEVDPEYRADRNLRILQRRPTFADEVRDEHRARAELNAGLRRADDYIERAGVSLAMARKMQEQQRAAGLPMLTTADMSERMSRETWALDSASCVIQTLSEGVRTGQRAQARKRVEKFQDEHVPKVPRPGAPLTRSSPISLIPVGSSMLPLADAGTDSSIISGALRRASDRLSQFAVSTRVPEALDSLRVRRERAAHRDAVADAAADARQRNPTLRAETAERVRSELATRSCVTRFSATLRAAGRDNGDSRYLQDSVDLARDIARDSVLRSSPRSLQAIDPRFDPGAWRRGNRR